LVLGATVVFGQVNYEPYEVRTVVPKVNGDPIGSHASLVPGDVAISPSGELIVVETATSCLRKIAPNGAVSTLAGNRGAVGFVDGKGEEALFRSPSAIAVDASGTIYVLDDVNCAVRKVTADGTVTTLAGGGGPGGPPNVGSRDGFGSDARFNFPRGITVSSAGTIYVGDSGNATIRAITPQGLVTTLSGSVGVRQSIDGPVATARFVAPGRMAADAKGNVYVLDSYAVRKITPDGNVSTLAGKPGEAAFADGVGSEARFSSFAGITAAPDGTLFVMDYDRLRRITPAGAVTTVAGGYPAQFLGDFFDRFDGKGAEARFRNAQGIALGPGGTLFTVDDQSIRSVSPDMTVTTLAPGTLFHLDNNPDDSGGIPPIGAPKDVSIDPAGNVYLGDANHACIRKITPGGVITTLRTLTTRPDGRTIPVAIYPNTLAVHPSGDVYFAETSAIGRIKPDGTAWRFAGDKIFAGSADGIGTAARFNGINRMVFDRQNNLYVADTYNSTIRKITPDAVVTTLAGSAGNAGSTDGTGNQARFAWPLGITTDPAGNVYVADAFYLANSQTIRKITPDGVVTTLAGLAGSDGVTDGIGSTARFHYPMAVTADSRGNIYVADAWNRRLRKVTANGVVTTLAGTDAISFGVDGIGSAASFDTIMPGIAVDGAGNVYVLDSGRLRIATSTVKARSLNVSTRLQVLDGENVLIGGFIIAGTSTKKVIIRALGPSLAANSITGALGNPALELYNAEGTRIASNDDWKIDSATLGSQQAAIEATTIPPSDDREAALVATLDPQQAYTAIVRGSHGEKGISVVEVYDLGNSSPAALANISTRGLVEPGEKVMIGGFILGGNDGHGEVLLRALGPSLANAGIANPLVNPTLALFDANGQLIASNDDWPAGDAAAIQATGLQPPNKLESAILITLPAGPYTAVVGGYEGSGVALVEVYNLP
jgi:hypothetical protein